ncbi:MAG: PLD nuclease N-terminal domain-containing protein [Steroidobacteraceae bacterium]
MLSTIIAGLIFIADIWAIVQVLSSGSSTATKLLWVLVILFLPVLGLILWLLAGPRAPARVV